MALRRTAKRGVMALAIVGIGALAALSPGVVRAFYEGVFPPDPLKRQALELCFLRDHQFNRLDPDQREACYHRMLQSPGEVPSATDMAQTPAANLVDLERAAGQGSLPRNDILRLQQNENALHSPH